MMFSSLLFSQIIMSLSSLYKTITENSFTDAEFSNFNPSILDKFNKILFKIVLYFEIIFSLCLSLAVLFVCFNLTANPKLFKYSTFSSGDFSFNSFSNCFVIRSVNCFTKLSFSSFFF